MKSVPDRATTNWGRWGSEDERGALNLIDDETVLAATRTPRTGHVYNLGLPVQRTDLPVVDYRGAPQRLTLVSHSDSDMYQAFQAPEGFGANEDVLVVPTHNGTHMDALSHVYSEGRLYNGFPAETFASHTGAGRCGVEKLGGFAGRGVLLDIARLHGVPQLEPGHAVTGTELESAAAAAEVELQRGDVLVVHTGWLTGFRNDPAGARLDAQPGLGLDAVDFVVDHEIAAVGADNSAIEVIPFDRGEFMAVHRELLVGYGVPFIEHLSLTELAADACTTFLFMVAPLLITGATGSPVNPIAIG
ncbi:MAG TPA: cyclase family protein [Amycolatopsis sp.]|nr:cyclase family protein [Amycolatopsis sp.]